MAAAHGASITDLKNMGRWESMSVPQQYIDDTVEAHNRHNRYLSNCLYYVSFLLPQVVASKPEPLTRSINVKLPIPLSEGPAVKLQET